MVCVSVGFREMTAKFDHFVIATYQSQRLISAMPAADFSKSARTGAPVSFVFGF
jgi:hypothetical protein